MAHGCVKFPATIVQIIFTEGPIAAQRNQSAVVDKDFQCGVLVHSLNLANARFILDGIALLTIDDKLKARIIQVRLSIAVGPPQSHALVLELRELIRIK